MASLQHGARSAAFSPSFTGFGRASFGMSAVKSGSAAWRRRSRRARTFASSLRVNMYPVDKAVVPYRAVQARRLCASGGAIEAPMIPGTSSTDRGSAHAAINCSARETWSNWPRSSGDTVRPGSASVAGCPNPSPETSTRVHTSAEGTSALGGTSAARTRSASFLSHSEHADANAPNATSAFGESERDWSSGYVPRRLYRKYRVKCRAFVASAKVSAWRRSDKRACPPRTRTAQ